MLPQRGPKVNRPVALPAPNAIHFHPPSGLLLPGAREPAAGRDLTDRLVAHHLERVRELLAAAATLPAAALERPLRPGFTAVWFEGEEASAALMAERLVFTLEVWVAAIVGEPAPTPGTGDPARRFERAAPAFVRLARKIRERGAGTTRSSTRSASRPVRSPTAACSPMCSATARSVARPWPACSPSSARVWPRATRWSGRRCAEGRAAVRSCGG